MWPLLVLGALASYKANSDANRRSNKIRKSMQAYQMGQARKSQAAIENLIGQSTPEHRRQEVADLEGARSNDMRAAVDRVAQFAPTPTAGKPSADRTQATSAAAASVAERTKRAIEQLARMGAPGESVRAGAKRFGRAATDVSSANNAIAQVGSGYRTDMSNVQPDPFLQLAGGLSTAAGLGLMRGRVRPSTSPFPDNGVMGP